MAIRSILATERNSKCLLLICIKLYTRTCASDKPQKEKKSMQTKYRKIQTYKNPLLHIRYITIYKINLLIQIILCLTLECKLLSNPNIITWDQNVPKIKTNDHLWFDFSISYEPPRYEFNCRFLKIIGSVTDQEKDVSFLDETGEPTVQCAAARLISSKKDTFFLDQ